MTLPVDTNVLLAGADARDDDHAACAALLHAHPGPLITTELVVAETGWLIECQLGAAAEARFYRLVAERKLMIEPLGLADWERIANLTERYADNGLGGVDASLIAVAERLKLDTVATLDHRHFRAVRPKHVSAFTLVP